MVSRTKNREKTRQALTIAFLAKSSGSITPSMLPARLVSEFDLLGKIRNEYGTLGKREPHVRIVYRLRLVIRFFQY